MLTTGILHPELLQILAGNGHGAKILIADANFPIGTAVLPSVKKIYLNLAPGLLSATAVLKVLQTAIRIEQAQAMAVPEGVDVAILEEYGRILGKDVNITCLNKPAFYQAILTNDTCLVIVTGETKIYANILLTIGVFLPGTD